MVSKLLEVEIRNIDITSRFRRIWVISEFIPNHLYMVSFVIPKHNFKSTYIVLWKANSRTADWSYEYSEQLLQFLFPKTYMYPFREIVRYFETMYSRNRMFDLSWVYCVVLQCHYDDLRGLTIVRNSHVDVLTAGLDGVVCAYNSRERKAGFKFQMKVCICTYYIWTVPRKTQHVDSA